MVELVLFLAAAIIFLQLGLGTYPAKEEDREKMYAKFSLLKNKKVMFGIAGFMFVFLVVRTFMWLGFH